MNRYIHLLLWEEWPSSFLEALAYAVRGVVNPVLLRATTDWSSITEDGISLKNLEGILREV